MMERGCDGHQVAAGERARVPLASGGDAGRDGVLRGAPDGEAGDQMEHADHGRASPPARRAYSSIAGPASQRLRDALATEAAATATSARCHPRASLAARAEFFSSSTVNPARSTRQRSPGAVNAK